MPNKQESNTRLLNELNRVFWGMLGRGSCSGGREWMTRWTRRALSLIQWPALGGGRVAGSSRPHIEDSQLRWFKDQGDCIISTSEELSRQTCLRWCLVVLKEVGFYLQIRGLMISGFRADFSLILSLVVSNVIFF